MSKQHDTYKMVPYPKLRRALAITLHSAQRKSMVRGLIEVDVTKAREILRKHKANTGESLSFTAFIITCLAQAVDENKSMHACRKGRKHLVLFDEVDVSTLIERDMAGQNCTLGHCFVFSSRVSLLYEKLFMHHVIRIQLR